MENTYTVKIREVLERNITLYATDKDSALSKIEELYNSQIIVLDADDFVGMDMSVKREGGF